MYRGVSLFRGVPVFRCSGVPVFRCFGVPMFLVLEHAEISCCTWTDRKYFEVKTKNSGFTL